MLAYRYCSVEEVAVMMACLCLWRVVYLWLRTNMLAYRYCSVEEVAVMMACVCLW